MCTAALVTLARLWKPPECSLRDKWTDMIHVYNRTLLIHNKKTMSSATTWGQLRIITEVSQKEKDKYHTISLKGGI